MSDNWLQEELKRESKLSVWDFDDRASYLDAEHKAHCAAREAKEKHLLEHEAPIRQVLTEKKIAVQDNQKIVATIISASIGVIVVIFMLIFITDELNFSPDMFGIILTFVEFMIIYIVVKAITNRRRK